MKKNLIGKYCMVRTFSALFAGILEELDGKECYLTNARRIFYWDGAASLSQLAMEGTKKPNNCKFSIPIDVFLTEVIEIIPITEIAKKSIESVKVWKII